MSKAIHRDVSVVVAVHSLYAVLTFDNWAVLHEKSYSSPAERQLRAAVWLENDDYIRQHNARDHSYLLGHNQSECEITEIKHAVRLDPWANLQLTEITTYYAQRITM